MVAPQVLGPVREAENPLGNAKNSGHTFEFNPNQVFNERMSKQFGQADLGIARYVDSLCSPEKDPLWGEVRRSAEANSIRPIHVGPMDGLILETLTRAIQPKTIVEIGTLVGYSGIRFCRGMGAKGRLYTFEFSPEHARVAAENFKKAGVVDQVQISIGPALEKLKTIESEGPFDLIFIDADKINYPGYLDWTIKNLRSGGTLLADNVFAWGEIAELTDTDPETIAAVHALRAFNQRVAECGLFLTTFLPTEEGLLMAVKH